MVQRDKPLNNLSFALEFLVCDLVDCLDNFDQQGVESVLFDQADLDSVKQGDEGLGRIDDKRRVGEVSLLGCLMRRTLFDGDGDTNT